MTIPIENIYYLLCYAWDKLDEKDIVDVEAIDSTTLADLFARVLLSGSNHLLRRGFDRGYVLHHERTSRLRGRICFQEAIRTNTTHTTKLPCEFDDLSYNILHNQILKATIRQLLCVDGLTHASAEGLAKLYRMFWEIEDIELNGRLFSQVQLHRNNHFYDFLLRICEIIYRNLLISEKSGHSKFRDFVQDRDQMAYLYENFVRTFYATHTNFKVSREDIQWRWVASNHLAKALLPKMQTDISLVSATRRIIIDCKYTPEATKTHYEAVKLRSSHLYQINAYMENLQRGPHIDTCEMMLLYPTVETPLTLEYKHNGHKISINTINLNQPWRGIHDDLLAIVA